MASSTIQRRGHNGSSLALSFVKIPARYLTPCMPGHLSVDDIGKADVAPADEFGNPVFLPPRDFKPPSNQRQANRIRMDHMEDEILAAEHLSDVQKARAITTLRRMRSVHLFVEHVHKVGKKLDYGIALAPAIRRRRKSRRTTSTNRLERVKRAEERDAKLRAAEEREAKAREEQKERVPELRAGRKLLGSSSSVG